MNDLSHFGGTIGAGAKNLFHREVQTNGFTV